MLSALHAWSLALISALAGLAFLWILARFSDQDRIQRAKRQVRSALYEFRLFPDQPRLLVRAQKNLITGTARHVFHLLKPLLISTAPFAVLFWFLDSNYGSRGLRAGEAAVLKAPYHSHPGGSEPALTSDGASIETPALRIPDENTIMWRIRLAGNASASVTLTNGSDTTHETIRTGLSPRLPRFQQHLKVVYPLDRLSMFGITLHWLVWFLLISGATMFAFRRRFGVVL